MVDCPVIFSGPMVRALLDGRKTQTRRLLKPQPVLLRGEWHARWGTVDRVWQDGCNPYAIPNWLRFSVGDRLWVKETLAEQEAASGLKFMGYAADGRQVEHTPAGWPYKRKSIPSIHMWRWASRLTLHVTDVRVQRLQEISTDDALAEGVDQESADPPFYYVPGIVPHSITAVGVEEPGGSHAARSYGKLMDYLHGAGFWTSNPWLIAVTFSVEQVNIQWARSSS